MIVRERSKKYDALQFTEQTKDHIYAICKASRNTGVELIDNHGIVYLHIDVPLAKDDLYTTITKKAIYGNWVIVDMETNMVIAVLNTEEFMSNFEPYK